MNVKKTDRQFADSAVKCGIIVLNVQNIKLQLRDYIY